MITDAHVEAIERLRTRLERGTPKFMEASAGDLPLLLTAVVELYDHNIALAEHGLRLALEAEERAKQDTLSMQLGEPRKDASR